MPDPVRVAVIDSGVQSAHPHIDPARLLAGVSIAGDGTIDGSSTATLDRLGHGTAVTAAIQDMAPAALCMPIRIFETSLRTTARALIAAIDWAVGAGAHIVNLSLGTTNAAHAPAFMVTVARARASGVLIIAARENGEMPCYPGCLPDAVGVTPDWDCIRETWLVEQKHDGLHFRSSGYPRPIEGVPQQRNLQGVSFAVANMSGHAARYRAEYGALSPGDLAALAPVSPHAGGVSAGKTSAR